MNISAVIVTRGDVDLTPILTTLPYDDVIVWDNSQRENVGLYGRYAAIAEAKHDVIYTQDDDLVFRHHQELADRYQDGLLVTNREQPYDIPWQARGSLFRRDLPFAAFDRYLAVYPDDDYFRFYACDGVFALLTPHAAYGWPVENLPWSENPGRISNSPGWWGDKRDEIQRRCATLTNG